MRIGGDVAVTVPYQNQVAITLQLVSGIGHNPVLCRLDRGPLRNGEVDPVIGLSIGFGAVACDDLAAHRPAEGWQCPRGLVGLDLRTGFGGIRRRIGLGQARTLLWSRSSNL